uniref:Uncharacterized protein n=1 Tax=Panagrolaimus davidi TaxID=227884 RepID=A0A914Q126_9BILA
MYHPEIEEEISEFKVFHGAIDNVKEYIQRQIDANGNGKFPASKASSHFCFLQQMQNELFFIASLVDPSAESYEPAKNLDCTLDDVQIPQSFMDDDIEVIFETSALACPDLFGSGEYRSRESISSVYYSAPQSINGDDELDRSQYLDEDLRYANTSIYAHEQNYLKMNASEVLVEPSPGKFLKSVESVQKIVTNESEIVSTKNDAIQQAEETPEVMVEDKENGVTVNLEKLYHTYFAPKAAIQEVTKDDANLQKPPKIEPEATLQENDAADDDDSIVSDAPPPKYREPNKLLDSTNDYGRSSDISTSCVQQENQGFESAKTPTEEYVETPPPSPLTADNSIDAITEAMEAIKLNRSSVMDNVVYDQILSGYNEQMIPENDAIQNYLKQNHSILDTSSLDDSITSIRSPLKDVQI